MAYYIFVQFAGGCWYYIANMQEVHLDTGSVLVERELSDMTGYVQRDNNTTNRTYQVIAADMLVGIEWQDDFERSLAWGKVSSENQQSGDNENIRPTYWENRTTIQCHEDLRNRLLEEDEEVSLPSLNHPDYDTSDDDDDSMPDLVPREDERLREWPERRYEIPMHVGSWTFLPQFQTTYIGNPQDHSECAEVDVNYCEELQRVVQNGLCGCRTVNRFPIVEIEEC